MNTKTIFSLLTFFLFFTYASCAFETSVDINTYFKSVLADSEERFILTVPEPGDLIMAVEFVFTKPSKNKVVTFNTYDKTPSENDTRLLSTVYDDNETGLISEEEVKNGKQVVYLKLNSEKKNIAFSIFINGDVSKSNDDLVQLRYRVAKTKPTFYDVRSEKLTINLQKDFLDVSFSGVTKFKDVNNDEAFQASYFVKFFDKRTIDNKISNPSAYYLLFSYRPLTELTFKLKGQTAGNNIYARLKATLNNKDAQYIIVYAVAGTNDEQEYVLYDPEAFSVSETSDEDIKPDDDKNKTDNNTDNNKNNTNEDTKDKEAANKEKNQMKFFIIIGAFVGIIVLVFIGIMIYIAISPKKGDKVEDNDDYKNVGAIRTTVNEDEA